MNISNQLQKAGNFLAQNRFKTILKKISASFMPVEVDSMAGKKS
jgi:hypothetical protein